MSSTVSTVPAVLDALYANWTLALPGTQVEDGQPLDVGRGDVLVVGFTGTPGEEAVTNTLTREQMSTAPDREQYDLANWISSWHGRERDAKAVRDGAYAVIDAMAADLARDQTLGGLVLRARLSTATFTPYQTNDGAACEVKVIVSVDAFTGR